MQKKLIALAIAGLSGAAFAQSNVTIYGVMDATFDNVSATGAANGAATNSGGRNRVTSNSSYIGFKGVEAIGNGYAVAFQIENGLDSSNGAAGVWNNRDTYVGLATPVGTFAMGNVTGPVRAIGAKFDVNAGATGIGANTALLGKGALQTNTILLGGSGASAFDQRINNAIAYISPNLSGFSGVIGYSTGFTGVGGFAGKEASSQVDGAKGNTGWTLGLNYENGPFYVGYAWVEVSATNSGIAAADGMLGALSKAADQRLGVMYNYGAGTIGLLWDESKYTMSTNVFGVLAGTPTLKTSVWYLPVTYAFGPHKIIAQYGHAGNTSGAPAGVNMGDTGARHFEIGYEYSMSKRTTLKALWSQINNDNNAVYDFLYGVGQANGTATAGGAVGYGSKPKGFSLGMRHSF